MADYSDSKPIIGAIHPENAIESEAQRHEPILTPQQLVQRHLFGIPLISAYKNPFTNKPDIITPEMLKDYIDGAVQLAEDLTGIDIYPNQIQEKHAFDFHAYNSFGYIQLRHRPVASVEHINVLPSNGQEVYVLPKEWLEMANAIRGQINIIPMTAAMVHGGTTSTMQTGAAFFFSIVSGNRGWVPAYWGTKYTSGFPNSMVPRVVNELIGTIAAMEILSMLATTHAGSNSHSLGIDGLSQSVSTPGPQLFQARLGELEEKKKKLVKKMKYLYGTGFFASHV